VIRVNTRVITATNRDLEQLVKQERFREDRYYRISLFPVHVPPLRERLEDIPLLAEHFLFQVDARFGVRARQLSEGALAKLKSHRWPGNLRELRNVIERAAILSRSPQISSESIRFSFEHGQSDERTAGGSSAEPLASQVERLERRIIAEALRSSPSKRQAASLLGMSHTALLKRLKKYQSITETKDSSGNQGFH